MKLQKYLRVNTVLIQSKKKMELQRKDFHLTHVYTCYIYFSYCSVSCEGMPLLVTSGIFKCLFQTYWPSCRHIHQLL